MKRVHTYKVEIFMGSRSGYTEKIFSYEKVHDICQNYCNDVKLGLTLTKTEYIYVSGNEPGYIIGLINYPRFPDGEVNINEKAFTLAKLLLVNLEQERCTVMTPFETFLLEKEDID